MTFGFQNYNDAGIAQIDENYRNLLKVASGTYSGAGTNLGTVSFATQTTTAPLIFIRPSADGVYIGANSVTNNGFTFQSNGAFDWVVYGLDSVVNISSTNMGMQVFDAAGNITYDSRYEAVRIPVTLSLNQAWPSYVQNGGSGSFMSYPYTLSFSGWGAKPWICLNQLVFDENHDGATICATTSGTNSIILQCGSITSGTSWTFYTNDGSSGFYTVAYPGGQMRIPLLRK